MNLQSNAESMRYFARIAPNPWLWAGLAALSYFIGNISPAILIGRMFGVDIRKQGSGNAGATNVLRVLGKKAAVATLVIDIAKGACAVLIGRIFGGDTLALLCGFCVFCGHIWPAVFGFKGGKGVATALGVIAAVQPLLGLIELAAVLLIIAATRRVSAGSVVGALLFPFAVYFFGAGPPPYAYLPWAIALALIVLLKHRANLIRLLKGQEPKLSFKK